MFNPAHRHRLNPTPTINLLHVDSAVPTDIGTFGSASPNVLVSGSPFNAFTTRIFHNIDLSVLAIIAFSVLFASLFIASLYCNLAPLDRLLWFFYGRPSRRHRLSKQFVLVDAVETKDGLVAEVVTEPAKMTAQRYPNFLTVPGQHQGISAHNPSPPPPAYTLPQRFPGVYTPDRLDTSSPNPDTHAPVIHVRPPSPPPSHNWHDQFSPMPSSAPPVRVLLGSPEPDAPERLVGLGLGLGLGPHQQQPLSSDTSAECRPSSPICLPSPPEILNPFTDPHVHSTPYVLAARAQASALALGQHPSAPLAAKVRRSFSQSVGFYPGAVRGAPARPALYPVDSSGKPVPIPVQTPSPTTYVSLFPGDINAFPIYRGPLVSTPSSDNTNTEGALGSGRQGSSRSAGMRRLSTRLTATSRTLSVQTKRILGIEAVVARREEAARRRALKHLQEQKEEQEELKY